MEPCRPNAAVDMIPNTRYIIKRSEKVFFGKKKNAAPAFPTVQKTAPLFDKGMNVLVTRCRAQDGGIVAQHRPAHRARGRGIIGG